jgi:hypothetical protein
MLSTFPKVIYCEDPLNWTAESPLMLLDWRVGELTAVPVNPLLLLSRHRERLEPDRVSVAGSAASNHNDSPSTSSGEKGRVATTLDR